MLIVGCDFHPSWQQVAWLDTETGETGEQKLVHATGEAKQFYERLPKPALIGMEATGNSQWFIEMVQDLGGDCGLSSRRLLGTFCRRNLPIYQRTNAGCVDSCLHNLPHFDSGHASPDYYL
jgi:hypothetical protein